jgi:mRNA interferase MazF
MIRRGEIYWIGSRQSRGSEQAGRRPALIIQNDFGNETSETTIVALMTSHAFSRDYPFHVAVGPAESGLPGPSTVLLEQLQTVSTERLYQRAGSLPSHVMEQVDRAIHLSLGLID